MSGRSGFSGAARLLVSVLLLGALAACEAGQEPSPDVDLRVVEAVPSGAPHAVTGDWWGQVQERIAEGEYQLVEDAEGGLSFGNREQNLRARFGADGSVALSPRAVDEAVLGPANRQWSGSMRTRAFGRDQATSPVGTGDARSGDCDQTKRRDAKGACLRRAARDLGGLTEWWENRPEGLEQGWTVATAPPGEGPVTIELELTGLTATVDDDGAGATLDAGGSLLRYGSLLAVDADGRELPATLDGRADGLAIEVDDEGASYPIVIDPLIANVSWTAEADQAGAEFGYAVSGAGDVNGDGYDDVIVGAPPYDNGETNEGRAFVFLGSVAGLVATAAWTAESDQATATFGYSVATAGDVNGDGFDDVLVGARLFDNTLTDEGRASLFLGSATGLSAAADWVVDGGQAGSKLGFRVASAGDVNTDGYDDVLIAASGYDNGQTDEGRVSLYLGSSTGLPATAAWTAEGDQAGAWFGSSIASAGDVDGDGNDDVVIGAWWYDNGETDEGRAFLYLGTGTASGLQATPTWTAESDQVEAYFGWSVSGAGDVNGDGYADVVVGARLYDNGETDEGRASLYLGSSAGLQAAAAWTAEGDQAGAWYGNSVSGAGDVNGDGLDDVLIGAPYHDNGENDEGRASLYLGTSTGLEASPAWTAESNQGGTGTGGGAAFGWSVSGAGDMNGDGRGDVIVGARYWDGGQTDEGRAFLYYGSGQPALPGTESDWSVESDQAGAQHGYSVAGAGDVNNDGYDDVLVGAFTYDGGQTDEGAAFLYLGSPTGPAATAAWSGESNQANAGYGRWMAGIGDVNGDGFVDVAVSAHQYDGGEVNEGRAFVYFGSASGLGAAAAWTGECNVASASFGNSLSGAGDVNGDGFADLIVGAHIYQSGQQYEGAAFLYLGSASGLPPSPSWAEEGDQVSTYFGNSVAGAGDVNGDGFDDVLIGASSWDNGENNEGGAFLYLGSAAGLASAAAWSAESNQVQAGFGYRVAGAGDVNGDGYADVMVGAHQYDGGETDEGGAFLYLGSSAGLSATAAWQGESNQADASYGTGLSGAGDVNGDGFDDVLVGADQYDNGETDEGAAWLYLGSAAGLETTAAWMGESDQAGASFGGAVAGVGDTNGDGATDIIVGAKLYDGGQTDEGAAFLYLGEPLVDSLSVLPGWSAESDQAGAAFGFAVSGAGDVNADGYGDVLVGAYLYDGGQADEGAAFLYLGSAGGLARTPAWTAESDQPGAQLGFSVSSAGDVNGDGFGDVVLGAWKYDNGETDEGGAFLYLGSAAGLAGSAAWTAESDLAGAQFGCSVSSAGDVNGDGFSDVVVGAYGYDNVETDEGGAFLYLGSAAGLASSAAWTAESDQPSAYFGTSVSSAGDVNGDGFGDVVVGASGYDGGETDEGGAFLYLGSAGGLATSAAWTGESDQAVAQYGYSVSSAGDVNGDGYGDVIVGAGWYDTPLTDAGRTFVYLGSAGGLASSAAWTAEADRANSLFGGSVSSAGDVNGDGFGDVVIGAYPYSNGQAYEGGAFVYFGSASGLASTAAWSAESDQANAYYGVSVSSAGDVNGDGFGDVIVGAQGYDDGETDEGAAFLYLGAPSAPAEASLWTIESNQSNDQLGSSIASAGDVNGDGFEDVIVGAPQNGSAYLFLGSASGIGSAAAWSQAAGALFGESVSAAGDVNGDGYGDVIVGQTYFSNGESNEGAAYVFLGSATGLASTAAWSVEGNQVGAEASRVSGAGDVNGDGYSDVLVGAWQYDNGETDEGAAFLYLGSASGLDPTPAWTAEADQPSASFGRWVSSAGDVNGDGYADVIIGSPGYDGGIVDSGRSFVYLGSPAGLGTTPAWTADSDQANSRFGFSVSSAGDVNGDGFSDVLVGADQYANGEIAEGRAYMYLGSAQGLAAAPAWTAESNVAGATFGWSVGQAGDVNGDGFGDVAVGAPLYANGQTAEGATYLFLGSSSGLNQAPALLSESNQAAADLGYGVTGADVNGDGFSDLLAGARLFDGGQTNEGALFGWYGNSGDGTSAAFAAAPQARQPGVATPVSPGGRSLSQTGFDVAMRAQSPFGRGRAALQLEVKPAGAPFNGLGLVTPGAWVDTGLTGSVLQDAVSALPETRYHWRARAIYDPTQAPAQGWSHWFYGGLPGDPGGTHLRTACTGDVDGDGLCDSIDPDNDNDGDPLATDCNDNDPLVFTGATELCDAVDQDCDGTADDGFDVDVDGVTTCGPDGLSGTADDDCDDSDVTAFPGATEVCDGGDTDCDGTADEGFDTDGDGVTTCGPDGLPGTADDDCADGSAAIFPGASELCDGVDTDCDGSLVDEDGDADSDGLPECPLEVGAEWSSTETDATLSVAWGDWDGDGDLDLVAGANYAPTRVYDNVGGSFALAWSSTETDSARGVAWGDWDGDGDLDLAVANNGQPNRVYENTGSSLSLSWSSTEADATFSVAWGDWDGDGDLDLAVGNNSGQPNRVYANSGGSLALAWSSTETENTSSVAWGDWDGDGDPDLAVGNEGASGDANRVYENTGGGLTLAWSSTETDKTSSVAWGDWDNDGDLDLAAGNDGGQANRIYGNTGGNLALVWSSDETEDTRSVAWGDWDGDGDVDLAVGNNNVTQPSRVYENTGGALSVAWTSVETDGTSEVAWGDWDGDGDVELATGSNGQATRVYANLGGGLSLSWSSPEANRTLSVAWGDWDGDGDLDLAVGNTAQADRVYENNGGGLSLAWSSTETDETQSVAWGDWDGDGDLDLAVGNSAANRVYENTGGSLLLAWSSPETDSTFSVSWGDWDGDGDLDLAAGNYGQANRVYANSGGSLLLAWSSPETDSTRSVAWGDWDGDGDLDLAVGNYAAQRNRVYENSSGSLSLAWFSAETDETRSVNWGDWDGDGDLDLAVGNANGQATRVYANTGGNLLLAWSSTETDTTQSVAWGDWDGDGDLDLAVGNTPQANRVYANVGGSLSLAWSSNEADQTDSVVWGDWDGDGDLDLVAGNSDVNQPIRLYENRRISGPRLPNGPTYASAQSPGTTAVAPAGMSTAEILPGPAIAVPFTLFDADSDFAPSVRVEYSQVGGGSWTTATTTGASANLAASPTGVAHTLDWDAQTDGVSSDTVALRVVVEYQSPSTVPFPIQRGELSAVSPPIRVDAGCTPLDADNDGSTCDLDCDESDATVYPGAAELCDGLDNDCDGVVPADEVDADADTYRICDLDCDDGDAITYLGAPELCDGADNDCDTSVPADEADADGDGEMVCDGDCDDANAAVSTSAPEVCNAIDDDCDASIDEGFDVDGDGVTTCGVDGVLATADDDCDDSVATTYPGAPEVCNDNNDDCDGESDEGFDSDGDGVTTCGVDGIFGTADDDCDDASATTYPGATDVPDDGIDQDCSGTDTIICYWDGDGDNVGSYPVLASDGSCAGNGESAVSGDCDDADATVFPGATELCNGADEDCDIAIDEDFDADGDGYPIGASCTVTVDCDDGDAAINPGATEVCDGFDNNCDGSIDEEVDADGDTFTGCAGDCDDNDATVYPGATELCDGLDTDCDGAIPADETDDDGDTFDECDDGDCDDGDASINPGAVEACDGADTDCDGVVPSNEADGDGDTYLLCADDCDDADAATNPGATELCDGVDNDCDGTVPPDEVDEDGDTYRLCDGDCDDTDANVGPGTDGDGDGSPSCEDCDDDDPLTYPDADELCDGIDNDCDGAPEDPDDLTFYDWYEDADGDGFGDPDAAHPDNPLCAPPGEAGEYVSNSEDCDDADPALNPDAIEVCNGIDDDCDPTTDLDGADADADGDGFLACSPTEPDCDDADPDTWPGAEELCDGDVDNDCDGTEGGELGDPECWERGCTSCGSVAGEPAPPPEPLSMCLVALALGGLSLRRRRGR